MNFSPLLDAALAVQIHVAAVIPAALIGPCLFWARKGTVRHRFLGKIWLGLMVLAALSSFFIHSINLFFSFSPIHLLSVYVLYAAWRAIRAARLHRIREHKLNVIGMYVGGIIVAGGFTLLPDRIMHDVVFTYPAGWPDTARLMFFAGMTAGFVLLLSIVSALETWSRAVRGPADARATDRLEPGGVVPRS